MNKIKVLVLPSDRTGLKIPFSRTPHEITRII